MKKCDRDFKECICLDDNGNCGTDDICELDIKCTCGGNFWINQCYLYGCSREKEEELGL